MTSRRFRVPLVGAFPSRMSFTPDLDAYFARIGYSGPREPTLAVLHAITGAHASSIPFENLDVLLGRPIDLDPVAVERKLVHARRGGYCFEQNSHLQHVLIALGFRVAPLSARVRAQRPRDFTPARTHLFLRVEIDGASWITDCGIGAASLTSAIPLDESGQPLTTTHETRRIVREDGRLFHQILYGSEWNDVCEFTLEEMPVIDREVGNWYTSTHPQSHFKSRLIAARATPEGRLSILNNELIRRDRTGRAEHVPIGTADELLVILAKDFGLCFPAGTRFGPPGSPWPS